MLWNASGLPGYAIEASNGTVGTVSDLLFDDESWTVRWLVADTGSWFASRKVLLPVTALQQPDRATRRFPVNLTMQQVKDSPDIDMDAPVSRQNEGSLFESYGLDPYWGGGLFPLSNAMALPFAAPLAPDEAMQRQDTIAAAATVGHDHHLRSAAAVTGYHIHATDGEIGHVADFLVNGSGWAIRYITVDTSNWWGGKNVLLSPQSVRSFQSLCARLFWHDSSFRSRFNINLDSYQLLGSLSFVLKNFFASRRRHGCSEARSFDHDQSGHCREGLSKNRILQKRSL